MKNCLLLSALLLMLSMVSANSQTLEETQKHLDLLNGIPKQIADGKVAEAADATHKVFGFRPQFIDYITHSTVARGIQRKEQYCRDYLQLLTESKVKEIKLLVKPLSIWDQAIQTDNKDTLYILKQELQNSLIDKANIHSRSELYGLLTFRRLVLAGVVSENEQTVFLQQIINNLMPGTIETELADRATLERRAWSRYIISYCYHELYQRTLDAKLLYQATMFSPDMSDRSVEHVYFTDAIMLGQDVSLSVFKSEYLKHLIKSGKKEDILAFLMQTALIDPTRANRQAAEDYYTQDLDKSEFKTYWKSYLNAKGKTWPSLDLKFAEPHIDLKLADSNWMLVDIWGTWCSPCLQELPAIQEYYIASLKEQNYPEVYTLSYSSTKLAEFIKKNNYSFPVAEIDKKTVELLSVIGFPTKLLITPERRSLKIPFGSDWKQIVKTYMMID